MGYIFAYLSVIANAVKGFSSKKISSRVESTYGCIMFNVIRMLFCCGISFLYTMMISKASVLVVSPFQLFICFMSGCSLAAFMVSWILAIKSGVYMFVTSIGSASFIVPLLFGLMLFGEVFTVFKAIAILFIIVAMFFMFKYNISFTHKITSKQLLLLIAVFISQGLNQATQKMYTFYFPKENVSVYTFYSFIFTLIVLLFGLWYFKSEKEIAMEELQIRDNLKHIVSMSVAMFAVSYFQSLASLQIEAIVLYPLTSALSLVLGSFMASVLFKEKLKKECIIGIIFVFLALMFSRF